jgi:hypothetical protein
MGVIGVIGRIGFIARIARIGLIGRIVPEGPVAGLQATGRPFLSRHVVPLTTGPHQLPLFALQALPPEMYATQFMLVSKRWWLNPAHQIDVRVV